MNVKIKTVYGELSFNMTQENALALISTAHTYAEAYVNGMDKRRDDMIDALTYAVPALPPLHLGGEAVNTEKEQNAPPADKTKSRLESLFGDKSAWRLPPTTDTPAPEPKEEAASGAEEEEPYKGFLYIECEKCGLRKGFCTKTPITYHKCECGHKTTLRGLIPAHVKCECNSRFTYQTNIKREAFTIDCLHCGSPIDMELGGKGNAFVTVAFSEMYKQRGSKKR